MSVRPALSTPETPSRITSPTISGALTIARMQGSGFLPPRRISSHRVPPWTSPNRAMSRCDIVTESAIPSGPAARPYLSPRWRTDDVSAPHSRPLLPMPPAIADASSTALSRPGSSSGSSAAMTAGAQWPIWRARSSDRRWPGRVGRIEKPVPVLDVRAGRHRRQAPHAPAGPRAAAGPAKRRTSGYSLVDLHPVPTVFGAPTSQKRILYSFYRQKKSTEKLRDAHVVVVEKTVVGHRNIVPGLEPGEDVRDCPVHVVVDESEHLQLGR